MKQTMLRRNRKWYHTFMKDAELLSEYHYWKGNLTNYDFVQIAKELKVDITKLFEKDELLLKREFINEKRRFKRIQTMKKLIGVGENDEQN